MADLAVNTVFIGSCTNARIEDLRQAAEIVKGRRAAEGVRAMVVPGSEAVRAQAEKEGLDRVFKDAGFEWHHSGCSMCLGMNEDMLGEGERSASTSNRNFEGRQGKGGRTHLVSPSMRGATGSGSQRLYSFRDILVLQVVKRLLAWFHSLKSPTTATGDWPSL